MKETSGLVTKGGKPVVLLGTQVAAGQKAPDFILLGMDGKDVRLSDTRGKVRVLSVVYSVDTSVCDLQTQRLEEEAGKFKDVIFYNISMDLPPAQRRYTKAHENKNIQMLSDHRDASFGISYGILIKGERMLTRAVFIIGRDDTVRYAEYVKEVGQLPDLDRVVEVLKNLTKEPAPMRG